MFLIDWFYGILTFLGLRQKEAKILFLGLESSGKTELLCKLKGEVLFLDQILFQHRLTQYSTSEELSIGNIKFKLFDLGGHQISRRVWKDYNAKVDAVVYVVKPSNLKRLPESRRELDALLSDESLANVPFLILANVSYYPIPKELFLSRLGLTNFTTGKGMVNLGDTNVRPLEVFMYTLAQVHIDGFFEWTLVKGHIDGFKWLSQYIK